MDMISDTASDLGIHLSDIQNKIDRLQVGDATGIDEGTIEWHSIVEEKESTQRGLDMCAQLSAQVVQFQSAFPNHIHISDRPSAHEYVKRGLGEVGDSVQSLITRLRSHEASISSQLEDVSLKDGLVNTFSTIPFPPDPNFIERPAILESLRGKLRGPGGRAALVGLGGIG